MFQLQDAVTQQQEFHAKVSNVNIQILVLI